MTSPCKAFVIYKPHICVLELCSLSYETSWSQRSRKQPTAQCNAQELQKHRCRQEANDVVLEWRPAYLVRLNGRQPGQAQGNPTWSGPMSIPPGLVTCSNNLFRKRQKALQYIASCMLCHVQVASTHCLSIALSVYLVVCLSACASVTCTNADLKSDHPMPNIDERQTKTIEKYYVFEN